MADIPENAREVKFKKGAKCSLCTCGASQSLPYCDNEHRKLNEEKGTNYKSLKIFVDEDTSAHVSCSTWDD